MDRRLLFPFRTLTVHVGICDRCNRSSCDRCTKRQSPTLPPTPPQNYTPLPRSAPPAVRPARMACPHLRCSATAQAWAVVVRRPCLRGWCRRSPHCGTTIVVLLLAQHSRNSKRPRSEHREVGEVPPPPPPPLGFASTAATSPLSSPSPPTHTPPALLHCAVLVAALRQPS